MAKKPLEEALLEDAFVVTHPLRYRIVELLAETPMHINALSRALGVERRLIAYHLTTLEERGFVKSKYELFVLLKQKGTALRVYKVTDKVAEVKMSLKKAL
ncbi:MAG TPA: ArsR family transcriptional regulator [Methanomicrobia archaeon]|nr:ArsR family transcriptional regulator [Methanomicrobia archaeon]